MDKLSQRQRDVLYFMCQGYNNKKIASALNISLNTVRNHIDAIFEKLDVNNRIQAVLVALEAGWVE